MGIANVKVAWGLVRQGHIPTIGKMLAEGSDWKQIAKVIGWCPVTAKAHWLKTMETIKDGDS